MTPTPRASSRLWLGLVLTCLAAPVAAARPGDGSSSQAYAAIKDKREAHVEGYTRDLFGLIDACVADECFDVARGILDRIEELHRPPRTRRTTKHSSGVMVDAGAPDDGDMALTGGMPKDDVDAQLAAKREALAKKLEEARAKLGAGDASKQKASQLTKKVERATERFVEDQKDLAMKCVKQGYPAHAYELLLWTLQFDSENKKLRKSLLHQYPFDDKDGRTRWYTAFEIDKAKKGLKLDPEYGWVDAEQLKALKSGKLLYKGQWLDKAVVEEQRRDWANHWTYETQHYEIRTNAPLADAVEFGREVEKLYSFFFRVWVDFYAQGRRPDPNLVFGGGIDLGNRKLILNYYRSRESYLEACRTDPELASDPLLQQSAGFYDPNTHKAFFYREADGPDLTTIYHEATHQIFGETYPTGTRPPTWLVEGLAVFMEDPVVRGELGAERLLAGAEPPPGIRPGQPRNLPSFIQSFADRDAFHGAERHENYATAGAVVHFFMLYKGGQLRRGFITWAQEAYKNADYLVPASPKKLYDYLGMTPEQLQQAWVEFNGEPDLFDF